MPFDSNGNYELPNVYLATTGQTAVPAQHNTPLEDLASGMNSLLLRSGVASMTGPLKITSGSLSAPGLAFNTAASTGIYKTTTGYGMVVGGEIVAEFNTSGLVMAKTAMLKVGGEIASASTLTLGDGNIFTITGTTAITSIATKGVGAVVMLQFAGVLTLTHHATDLILTSANNIITAAGDWAEFQEYAAGDWRMVSYHRAEGNALVVTLPKGYIEGCILSNGTDATNDINIGAGSCRDSTDTVNIFVPAISGKQLDANWVVGGSAGMRDSSAGITNSTYHLYAVRTAASSAGDVYATTAATVSAALAALQIETGGSDYIYGRMIGSIIRKSGAITPFLQSTIDPDYFEISTPAMDYDGQPLTTTAVTMDLQSLPTGIKVMADIGAAVNAVSQGGGLFAWFSSLASPDISPTGNMYHVVSPASSVNHAIMRMRVETNTGAQIRGRMSHAGANDAMRVITYGFWHPRGRS